MQRTILGATDLSVSRIALGTSALGGMYRPATEDEGIKTVLAAFEAGINFFDTAPAYGNTAAERVLGKALQQLPRQETVICTKVGKLTDAEGRDSFDYSELAIRGSFEASCERLGLESVDILLLHDFDATAADADRALGEGLATLNELKREGRVRAVGAGIYDMELWKRVLSGHQIDVALVHNRHTLVDNRVFELLPLIQQLGVGLVCAAPFGSGLLSGQPLPEWHPAPADVRARVAEAAALIEAKGSSLPALALQFATSEPRVPVTLFSCVDRVELGRNLAWCEQRVERRLVAAAQALMEPAMNVTWPFGIERDGGSA